MIRLLKKASSYRTQAKWLDVMVASLGALMSRDVEPHQILPLVAVSITVDSPHEHPHRGFVAAPLQTPSSDSINRLYILPKTTSCDCDRLTETTPRFYKNNSLVWNFKTIYHLFVIDQVCISQLHSHTQSNFVLICLCRKIFRLDITHHYVIDVKKFQ
jgi:hypothetical protein